MLTLGNRFSLRSRRRRGEMLGASSDAVRAEADRLDSYIKAMEKEVDAGASHFDKGTYNALFDFFDGWAKFYKGLSPSMWSSNDSILRSLETWRKDAAGWRAKAAEKLGKPSTWGAPPAPMSTPESAEVSKAPPSEGWPWQAKAALAAAGLALIAWGYASEKGRG